MRMIKMLKSSLGFHTFTITKSITLKEAQTLYTDFYKYKSVNIIPEKVPAAPEGADDFTKSIYDRPPRYYTIVYPNKGKGIKWRLRFSHSSPKYFNYDQDDDRPCSVQAIINPKLLIGIKDYITAANITCMEEAATIFNCEAKRISPILGWCRDYKFTRVDYCVNFDIKELDIKCSPEMMMALINRSDIPPHYELRTDYSKTAHRNVAPKYSFYLDSKSVTINIYWKWYQLQKNFPNCPDKDNSLSVIRFEVQYKYPKIYNLSHVKVNEFCNFMESYKRYLLSDETAEDVISSYFNKVIHRGDYYTLKSAQNIIERQGFNCNKERRLIATLTLINRCRSIAKTKDRLFKKDMAIFRRSLLDIDQLGINPVTIPKEWGIKYIPNLFRTYQELVGRENNR